MVANINLDIGLLFGLLTIAYIYLGKTLAKFRHYEVMASVCFLISQIFTAIGIGLVYVEADAASAATAEFLGGLYGLVLFIPMLFLTFLAWGFLQDLIDALITDKEQTSQNSDKIDGRYRV